MQTLTQRRSVPVDAAKTAAIFGTLLIHASAAGGFAGAPGSFGWTSALFWNCLLRSAVPVFFLCSGALLLPPEKEVTVRRVWTKYIPRILAALLFWAAAYEGVELLRGWLRENGYRCTEERLVQDKGKLYVILSVTGGPSGEASDAERYGGFCLEHDPLYGLYLEQQLRRLYLRMDGLHRGGDESEAEPLAALADILEGKKEAWQRGNGQ